MAKRKRNPTEVEDYRHDATRKNNPPVGMVQYEVVRETPREHYAYDPHLSPQLVWANKPGLQSIEVEDAAGVDVDTVSLHIHERVSTQAIVQAVQRPQPSNCPSLPTLTCRWLRPSSSISTTWTGPTASSWVTACW
jgi:adenine-specific DNA-methyltransferase